MKNPATPDWAAALGAFRGRITERFFEPADELVRLDEDKPRGTFGFAILAIDFLVLETLQGFREGEGDHHGKSKQLFVNFLSSWKAFTDLHGAVDVPGRAEQLYKSGRCALHHSGSTDKIWVARRGPMVTFDNNDEVTLNRTAFHQNLKAAVEAYLTELVEIPNEQLRSNFVAKMKHITGV